MTEHTFTLKQMRAAIQAVTDGGHSVFSPSGSKMWMNCSGSLIPNIFAQDDAGEDAAEGTVGHMVGEQWLKTKARPTHLVGTKHWVESGDWGYLIEITDEMLDHVQRYVDWVKFLPGDHFVETRVDFSVLTPIPNQGGTADHVACTRGRMVISDLKYGKGVHVVALDNSQALLYAVGFFLEWDWFYDFQEFEIRIAQPRRDNMDVWIVDRDYILAFMEKVKVRAAAAWVQNAPRSPGAETCRWCKVASTCTANAKLMIELTEGIFPDLHPEVTTAEMVAFKRELDEREGVQAANPALMDTAHLGKLLLWRSTVEGFFKKVDSELFRRANAGDHSSEWKIVEGGSHRVFRNKKATAAALIAAGCKRSDVMLEEIPSPAQAEVLLRKAGMPKALIPEFLEEFIFKPPGKATLARASDKRRPIVDGTDELFGDTTDKRENEEPRNGTTETDEIG